jgi:2-polyprenyl-6-methoxyphenol hydroxylase-like FAD-dependent oxidoreductase
MQDLQIGGTSEETFVLIAGGGPIGLTAAIALGRRGVPAILVNERLETATHPKCNNTNSRTMEHFRRLGLADDIHAASLPPTVAREYAYVTRFCGYEFARMGRPHPYMDKGRKVGGNPDFLRSPETPQYIPQTSLEPILKAHAERQQSVSVRFGWRVLSVKESADGVVAQVENVTTGERHAIAAQYVLAADGARSLIRRELGIEMAGEDGTVERAFMTGTMLSHHIRAPKLVEQSGRAPALITWVTNHDARGFMFAQDERSRWIVHYQVPRGVDWQTLDPRDIIRRMIGTDTEFEILSGGPWIGGLALVADHYQTQRIFLAGDAAHLYTPLGAFGMNTGVGDAINICWKLAAVHAGWAGPELLATYEAERRPIGIRNSKHGISCAQRQSAWPIPPDVEADTPQAEAGRKALGAYCLEDDREQYNTAGIQLGERYENSPIILADDTPPPPDTWYSYTAYDRAGARAPHLTLGDGRSLYAAFGADFTLLAFDDGDPSSLDAAAKHCGMPLTVVRTAGAPPEPYQSSLVLVRPDHHIAWHGSQAPADASAVIDRVRGAQLQAQTAISHSAARASKDRRSGAARGA